jgi:hypothetical protein
MLQDSRIWCRLHAKVPQVDGIVSRRLQAFAKERGQVVVDEEFHAVCRSGNSRSRTASAA